MSIGAAAGWIDDSELTAYARIRRAALVSFARVGIAATTIRGVAAAAGVSPGLVQHHFRSKEGLRAAVDAFVLERATRAVAEAASRGSPADIAAGFSERIAEFIRSSPEFVAYARRSLLEGDSAGLALFDALVALGRSELERLAAEGLLRPDLDLTWSALHIVLLSVAPVLLEPAVDRHLDRPFLSDEGTARWRDATSMLFAGGVYRGGSAPSPVSPGANDPE
jgi:AcrR family transcriptional regulator